MLVYPRHVCICIASLLSSSYTSIFRVFSISDDSRECVCAWRMRGELEVFVELSFCPALLLSRASQGTKTIGNVLLSSLHVFPRNLLSFSLSPSLFFCVSVVRVGEVAGASLPFSGEASFKVGGHEF